MPWQAFPDVAQQLWCKDTIVFCLPIHIWIFPVLLAGFQPLSFKINLFRLLRLRRLWMVQPGILYRSHIIGWLVVCTCGMWLAEFFVLQWNKSIIWASFISSHLLLEKSDYQLNVFHLKSDQAREPWGITAPDVYNRGYLIRAVGWNGLTFLDNLS